MKEDPIIDLDKLQGNGHLRKKKKSAGHARRTLITKTLLASSLGATSMAPDMAHQAYTTFKETRHSSATEYLSSEYLTDKVDGLRDLFNDTVKDHPDAFVSELSSVLPPDQQGQTLSHWQEVQEPKKAGIIYDITLITTRPTSPDDKARVIEIRYEEKSIMSDTTTIQDDTTLRLVRRINDPNKWFIYQNGRWSLYPYPLLQRVSFTTGESIYPMTDEDLKNFSELVENSLHASSEKGER